MVSLGLVPLATAVSSAAIPTGAQEHAKDDMATCWDMLLRRRVRCVVASARSGSCALSLAASVRISILANVFVDRSDTYNISSMCRYGRADEPPCPEIACTGTQPPSRRKHHLFVVIGSLGRTIRQCNSARWSSTLVRSPT
ncbi:hypothetical protein C8Q73DRAFT_700360 [Cubamyces lactineus]|nr:hypothetical protein C8Q73DRAFT_700360 [Cubamyces lactineus]